MTRFHHLAAGTPHTRWQRRGLAELPVVAVPGHGDSILVLAAHPDDETLGAGALIAQAAAAGAEVTVVVATHGEASHPHSPTHSAQQLIELRTHEVRAALHRLHPSLKPVFLGLPDGNLQASADGLTATLRQYVQGRTHLITPWTGDRHPDHHACAEAIAALRPAGVHWWQYPIWAWHWDDPDSPAMPWTKLRRTKPASEALDAKREAIDEHRSQHTRLSAAAGDEAILQPAFVDHFRHDHEYFVLDALAGDPAFFDQFYAADHDPWSLDTSPYERRKRARLVNALPHARFRRAFEPGCALGSLTAELAERCDEVVAWDAAHSMVERSRERFRHRPSVQIDRGAIPTHWPDASFDLIVLSEIVYYCHDLDAVNRRIEETLTANGILAAVHWRGDAPDHPHSADTVHATLGRRMRHIAGHIDENFLLDVWMRKLDRG